MTKSYGIWRASGDWTASLAAELEEAGFAELWIGGVNDDSLHIAEELLAATVDIPVV